jgi:hypothetical protein
MINGAHLLLYTSDADADRAFLRDVLKFPNVDAGHGWLIFALPPAEIAVHPADAAPHAELYLMCDDVRAQVKTLEAKGITCGELQTERWGIRTAITLPSGAHLGLYQPTHPTAIKI